MSLADIFIVACSRVDDLDIACEILFTPEAAEIVEAGL